MRCIFVTFNFCSYFSYSQFAFLLHCARWSDKYFLQMYHAFFPLGKTLEWWSLQVLVVISGRGRGEELFLEINRELNRLRAQWREISIELGLVRESLIINRGLNWLRSEKWEERWGYCLKQGQHRAELVERSWLIPKNTITNKQTNKHNYIHVIACPSRPLYHLWGKPSERNFAKENTQKINHHHTNIPHCFFYVLLEGNFVFTWYVHVLK